MKPERTDKGNLVVYICENKKGQAKFISFSENEARKKGFPIRVRYIKDE